MAVLQECPLCKFKQTHTNRKCKCGYDLMKGKKQGKIRYFHTYRKRNGWREKDGKRVPKYTQCKEYAGDNLKEALAVEGKRKAQKEEGILEKQPGLKLTFNELTEWYVNLTSIKALAYHKDLKNYLSNFNAVFGETIIYDLSPEELKEYQLMRKKEGYAGSYIDKHIGSARTMINRAWDNDKIGGDALKPFKLVKRMLKNSRANARDRILSSEEYMAIMEHLPLHQKGVFATGYYTGMRLDEILTLTWDKIDFRKGFIYLQAEDTKDDEKRSIPINDELQLHLERIPQGIHDNHVFLYRGKPLKDIREGLKRACKKAGVLYGQKVECGFIFHDLRHTFNTNMRKAGVPESVIMEITGHATREMFDRYNTVDDSDKRQAAERMSEFLQECCQNVAKNG